MPAGKTLIDNVAAALHPQEGATAADIMFSLPEPKPSSRAVRYALKTLVETGRARRKAGVIWAIPVQITRGVIVESATEPQAAE